MERLGWIGLGRLGSRLAPRLVAAGHALRVYDSDPTCGLPGATRASSASEVAAACDIVFLCVTDTEAVASTAAELARGPGAGKLLVDHTSAHPARTREIAAALEAANGIRWVDAPISGPTGTGAAFLGGAEADVARARPFISAYAATVTHLGPLGAGQAAKSASQLVVAATIAAWSEALAYVEAAGLDAGRFLAACAGAGSDSSVRGHFAPELLAGRIAPKTIRNMIEDMETVRDVARGAALPVPIADLVRSWLGKGEAP
jgi:3-hydroxyisobutyrate dehydrogenase